MFRHNHIVVSIPIPYRNSIDIDFTRRVDSDKIQAIMAIPESLRYNPRPNSKPTLSELNRRESMARAIEQEQIRKLNITRFIRGPLGEAVNPFRKLAQDAREENPDVGTYELSKAIVDQLPPKTPSKAYQNALQAFANTDPDPDTRERIRRLGQEAFLLLNMKTLLTVVDSHFKEELDSKEDREEMMHSAIASVCEKLPTLKPSPTISQQVNKFAKDGVVEFLAKRDNMPMSWMRNPEIRGIIATRIKEAFGEGNRILTNEEIDSLSHALSEETGINEENLKLYINHRNSLRIEEDKTNQDQTFKEATDYSLKDNVNKALQTITPRQARVLTLRFGLKDGKERVLSEVGKEFGVTGETIRQIEAKAFMRLRHPTRARQLRPYLDEEVLRPIAVIHPVSSSTIEITTERDSPYSIKTLNLPNTIKHQAYTSGIKNSGDFFSASPSEIAEGWHGNIGDLKTAVKEILKVTKRLESISITDISNSEIGLLEHFTESILYQDKKSALKNLNRIQKIIIGKKFGILDENDYPEEEIAKFSNMEPAIRSYFEINAQKRILADGTKRLQSLLR